MTMNRLPMKPSIQSGREISRHTVGDFTMVVYDEIKSVDVVEYAFVAALFKKGDGEAQLYLTSEKNTSPIGALFESLGIDSEPTGSHYLCAFDIDGHSNYGASDDWADATKFIEKANESLEEGLTPRT
jgi:hypothetical protein